MNHILNCGEEIISHKNYITQRSDFGNLLQNTSNVYVKTQYKIKSNDTASS